MYFFDFADQVADQSIDQSDNHSWDHVFLCVDHIDQVADQSVDQLQPGSLLLPAVHGVVGWQIKIFENS